MTTHQRYARACTTAALLTTTATLYAWHQTAWLPMAGLGYGTALLAACAHREYTAHQRVMAEREWARRRTLGENPPPLTPCCMWVATSDGAAHDPRRCTRDRRFEDQIADFYDDEDGAA